MLRYQLCLFLLFKTVLSSDNNTLPINNISENGNTFIAEGINIAVDELPHNKDHQTVRHASPNVVPRKGVSLPNLPLPHATSESPSPIKSDEVLAKVPSKLDNSSSSQIINNATKGQLHLKPTATIIDTKADPKKNYHSSPTRTPPLGMPSKMTYVAPVILTILILPLFILSMVYIYKHGRDCWNKRHYRRMDFLIDGMYNE